MRDRKASLSRGGFGFDTQSNHNKVLSDYQFERESQRLENDYGYKEPVMEDIPSSVAEFYNKKLHQAKPERKFRFSYLKQRQAIEQRSLNAKNQFDIPLSSIRSEVKKD